MNLSELFAIWQVWNARDTVEQAARRAETVGRGDVADDLRRGLDRDSAAPTAIEALAAQHKLAELLGSWRWHTVTAAREQGATWDDIAAVTGTDPATAQQGFSEQLAQAEHAAAQSGITFHDAERYRAAAADDAPNVPERDAPRALTGEETRAMTDDRDDHRIEHISGPDSVEDGLVTGEIALPGGLPPEDDEEDESYIRRWDDAFQIADRDGYVMFDPNTPAGFRALTADERAELTDSIRAGTPPELVQTANAEVAADRHDRVAPRANAEGVPWVESKEEIAERERWAVENADPVKAQDGSHPDDIDRLQQRLDDLRMQLSGYTWREGVDRDEALADRREQLGRWYDDDTDQTSPSDGEQTDDGHGLLPNCLIYPDDPRWDQ